MQEENEYHDELRRRLVILQGQLTRVLELLETREVAEPEPVEPRRDGITWQQVAGAYAKRYQALRGIAWHYGAHVQALEDLTAQINSQEGNPRELGKLLMDNFFADDYAKKLDYPPALMAKQFGRYLKPVTEDSAAQDDERRKRALEAQRRHEEAKARAEAEHARAVAARLGDTPVDTTALEELKQWLKKDAP
jgi:hypothetical protein